VSSQRGLWHHTKVGADGSESATPPSSQRIAKVGNSPQSPDIERLRRNLDTYMSEKGLRTTEQRKLIVTTFLESRSHSTVEELLARVRAADPKVGYATVYRTMKMLSEGGLANELHFGDGATRYEIADEDAHHDHLICVDCGHIIEFEEPLIEELQERIAAGYGFRVTHHKHELYGHCGDSDACQSRRDRSQSQSIR
jgi:Fur family ferric uptake transcriptional regulator